MTVIEYNENFAPKLADALALLGVIANDESIKSKLEQAGWNDEMKKFIQNALLEYDRKARSSVWKGNDNV